MCHLELLSTNGKEDTKSFSPSSTSIATSFFLLGGIFPHSCFSFCPLLPPLHPWAAQRGKLILSKRSSVKKPGYTHTCTHVARAHTCTGTGAPPPLSDWAPWQPWKKCILFDYNQEPEETHNRLVNQNNDRRLTEAQHVHAQMANSITLFHTEASPEPIPRFPFFKRIFTYIHNYDNLYLKSFHHVFVTQ